VTQCLTPPSVEEGGPSSTLFLVGDSHAGALYSGVADAIRGRMRMAFVARAGNGFYPKYMHADGGEQEFGSPQSWMNVQLRTLRANMRSGDVLCIVNQHGFTNYRWLRESLLPIIPDGAKVMLVGDSPFIDHMPVLCHSNPNLCRGIYPTEYDAQLQSFAEDHSNVLAFIQTPFWRPPPGDYFWGNAPGTTTNLYEDTHHLLPVGASYVRPYLCSALEQWNLI